VKHWAHERLLLKVRSGSQAHGLATPESDVDSRGVCVPPKKYLLGLSSFEQWESDGGDHVIFSLQKFVRLALDGNPNIIETLYTRTEDHLFVHPLAHELLERRDMFLSRKVGFKFGRYAIHQLQKIERHHRWLTTDPPVKPTPEAFGAVLGENSPKFPDTAAEKAFRAAVKHHRAYRAWRKNRNPKRAVLEEKYGYDTKHAMHLCRLLKMGCEILDQGEVHVFRPDADWLRGVRGGQLSYQELLEWVREMEQRLADFEEKSTLPEAPDFDKAEEMVIGITEQFLGSS
jgi:predicted nucleotidyltransferase